MTDQLDIKRIINRFGGPAALRRTLADNGHAISIKTIEKWHERGNIQGKWLAVMASIARRRGESLDLTEYLSPKSPPPQGQAPTHKTKADGGSETTENSNPKSNHPFGQCRYSDDYLRMLNNIK